MELRSNGKLEVLDPYWIFQAEFTGDCMLINDHSDEAVLPYVYKMASGMKTKIKTKREKQLEKVSGFLAKMFRLQANDVLDKDQSITEYAVKENWMLLFLAKRDMKHG